MFKDYFWKPIYNSYVDNIGDFYNSALQSSIYYNRVSAYFSAKALSKYGEGLEYFRNNNKKYRLIISKDISEQDFLDIKNGYEIRNEILNQMSDSLNEHLNDEQLKRMSNLAYYISVGVIDVKIAFVKKGIFHDKFGIFEDEENNVMIIRGSNNETSAAIDENYESFELTCDWLASEFDKMKITIQKDMFNKLWNNEVENIFVKNIPEVLLDKIMTFNKGQIIIDMAYLNDNTFVFDLIDDECCIKCLFNNFDDIKKTGKFKIYLSNYICTYEQSTIYIYNSDSPRHILEVFNKFNKVFDNSNLKVIMTDRLKEYIDEKLLYIEKRYNLGISIKHRDERLLNDFNQFSIIVDSELERKLRINQMWDAFYMFTMQRSSNFSVPGSGKTTSVYAVSSVLFEKNIINKIVVIGPKNSFLSWKDEFIACFGNKKKLNCLDISRYTNLNQRKNILKYHANEYNLILLNYEIIESIEDELKLVISNKSMLVYDEVHKIKAIDGVRSIPSVNVAKHAKYVITMTGTPIPNSYTDLYNNLNILYPFDYTHFFGFSINTLKNPSLAQIKKINDKLYPFFCRTTKKDLQVPEANKDIIEMGSCTENELKLYKILISKYRNNKLAFIIRLLQMESDPKMLLKAVENDAFDNVFTDIELLPDFCDYSQDIVELINNIGKTTKFNNTINLIKKLVSLNKKVIVWCIFTDTINNFISELRSFNINCNFINGGTSQMNRENIINEFKSNNFDVLITNPHTLAESVSLHSVCHDAIYFEYSYNLTHLLQSKDRIHRLGLPDGMYTQYYYMMQSYEKDISLNQRIYDRLCEKELNMLNAIDNNVLENIYTTQEDINFILKGLL